jgi:hypothetical protein
MLRWEAQDVTDDTFVRNPVRELVHVARDAAGDEWMVSKHDDGRWQWIHCEAGDPVHMGEGFATDELARAAAERFAAQLAAAADLPKLPRASRGRR